VGVLKRWAIALVPIALLAAACSGGKSSKTPTAATSSPAVSATASPTSAPPPARPAALADYARTAAAYLTANPGAAGNCLAAVYAAWQMPLIAPSTACTLANTDADGNQEVVAVFTAPSPGPNGTAGVAYDVVVFDRGTGGYQAAYESGEQQVARPGTQAVQPVLFAGDMLGGGGGALAYTTEECGASTCSTTVHVVRGTASGYAPITPDGGITLATVTSVKVEDAGDGTKRIVLTGGEFGSVGAGPQRQETEVWTWNGTQYALTSTTQAPPVYLYHAVKGADALFAAGKYAEAEAAYVATIGNDRLKVWNAEKNERNELEAYALFRAGLAELVKSGGDRGTAEGYLQRADGYKDTLNRQLAGAFEAAYAAKGEVSVGCGAVQEDIQANLSEYQQFWDFGYGNPAFDPNAVCPF